MKNLFTKSCEDLFANSHICYNLCTVMHEQATQIYSSQISLKVHWNATYSNIQNDTYHGLMSNMLEYLKSECVSFDDFFDNSQQPKFDLATAISIILCTISTALIIMNFLETHEMELEDKSKTERVSACLGGIFGVFFSVPLLKNLRHYQSVDSCDNVHPLFDLLLFNYLLIMFAAGRYVGSSCGKKLFILTCFNREQHQDLPVAQEIEITTNEEQLGLIYNPRSSIPYAL